MELSGRTCIITGGAQGIGWAIAALLASRGMRVYVGDICPRRLENAAAEAAAAAWGKQVHLTACDVAERAAVDTWVTNILAQAGCIDVLINNAATAHWDEVATMSVDHHQRMMRVGYEGMVFCTQAVLPSMLQVGHGHIINMGSIAGEMFLFGGCAAYSAAKAAMAAYTHVLRIELRNTAVRVTLMRPGLVVGTSLLHRLADSRRLPRIADLLPVATPQQVARSVLHALQHVPAVVTVPWQYRILNGLYHVFPGLSRWLCRQGGPGRRRYEVPTDAPIESPRP